MITKDPAILMTAILCFGVFVPFFYPVCDLGESVTATFARMEQNIHDILWYECPVDHQKLLIFMIAMAQRPYRVIIFGDISCSRDTFKMVILPIDFSDYTDLITQLSK